MSNSYELVEIDPLEAREDCIYEYIHTCGNSFAVKPHQFSQWRCTCNMLNDPRDWKVYERVPIKGGKDSKVVTTERFTSEQLKFKSQVELDGILESRKRELAAAQNTKAQTISDILQFERDISEMTNGSQERP